MVTRKPWNQLKSSSQWKTDGTIRRHVSAYTTGRVAGNLPVVDWSRYKSRWSHLKDIDFPKVGHWSKVDMLIGLDQADLMTYEEEVQSDFGDPIAQKILSGWTCLGRSDKSEANTYFTFFVKNTENTDNHDNLLWYYWETDRSLQTWRPTCFRKCQQIPDLNWRPILH